MHQNVIDDRIVLLNSGKYWGIRIACSSCQFLVTAAATAAFSPFPVLNLRFCVNCSLPSYCNILTLPTNAAASTNIEQNSSQQSFKIYWKLRWESITVPRISARSRHTLLCLYLTSCKYASVYSCGVVHNPCRMWHSVTHMYGQCQVCPRDSVTLLLTHIMHNRVSYQNYSSN